MKKIFYITSFSFLLLFLSSCLTTLYPIFHANDAIYNERLLGYWKCVDKGKNISYMEFRKIPDDYKQELSPDIRKISDKGYLVSRINSKEEITSQHLVFLAKIGEFYYLDYYPAEMPSQKIINKNYRNHFVKVHSNYRCDIKDNNHFEMKLFDKSFLDKLVSKNQINIRHEVIDGKNIFTASTDDLQKFIKQYGDNREAFGDDITYCIIKYFIYESVLYFHYFNITDFNFLCYNSTVFGYA